MAASGRERRLGMPAKRSGSLFPALIQKALVAAGIR